MKQVGDPVRKSDRRYTYGDYCTWGNEESWELIDGVAWSMSPSPGRRHQEIAAMLLSELVLFLKGKACRAYGAPFDVILGDHPNQSTAEAATVVQPDISVICDKSKLTDAGCTGAPDLVVEILSPSTARKDMEIKRDLYRLHGVHEYWIVDPANQYILVYVAAEDGTWTREPALYAAGDSADAPERPLLESTVLPGFRIDLQEMFAA